MAMFFINKKEKEKFYNYIRDSMGLILVRDVLEIGKPQRYDKGMQLDRWVYNEFPTYQQVRIDLKREDITALKLMFDIKSSLFR